ncbi:pilus assembly protein TadG-related protein [Brevundimonas sp.]|uniref:TadE/TadG family type IV pilus assembly protein n=1 Tax=Brevundimonas sp. TaxID=1871086 RepID=UPI003BADA819
MGVGNGLLKQAKACVRNFARSRRGNVAMIFALTLPILVMLTMGGVDISRAATVRVNLQDALDAATLAAARSSATTDVALKEVGLRALRANLAGYKGVTLREDQVTFTLNNDQVVIANAKVDVKAMVANIILPPYGKLLDDTLPVGAHSEVNRSSKDIEVALVLDITGSMDNCTKNCPAKSKLQNLQDAAKQLVNIVVQPTQTPFYTRMAIVPYSVGVNVGTYANGARGSLTQYVNITGASWSTGTSKVITGVSKANTAVISATAHGFVDNDTVWITGLADGSSSGTRYSTLNDAAYTVTRINANSFSIKKNGAAVNTNAFRTFASSSSGMVTKCQVTDCSIVITAPGHNIPANTNDQGSSKPGTVYISNVAGMTQINGQGYEVGNVTNTSFSIGVNGYNMGKYTSGGRSWCGQDTCQWRVFRNMSNAVTAVEASTCVSERTGSSRYTDASPSARVGRNYAPTANPCPSAVIQPLTADKPTLTKLINDLSATGSTSGQIGLAWGWYTVSPNFNTLWNGAATAATYNTRSTLKAVILMTDGEFNGPYCTGVIARDAGTGSGADANKINCNATNGDPFAQSAALCNAMKAQNIVIYTVGFQIAAGGDAARMLANCATSSDYAFLPNSGDDLSDDFEAIGRDITRLRISK